VQLFAATSIKSERIASGFNDPLYVTSPPFDFDRLFVVEQRGRIKIIKEGVVLGTDFLNISTKVSSSGNERGLLGFAFHPDYDSNGFFYVSYTQSSGGASVVERYQVSGNPDVADPASGLIIFGPVSQPFSNHNGGCILFGPDEKLYLGLGDGGSAGDPDCNAQKGDTLLGKILRLNDDGTVPDDNPFLTNNRFLNEIWSYGLRNPWRFSFDRETGDLYIGDVGQGSWEEVDYQPASSTGGENYGWKVMEGSSCFSTSNCPNGTPPCNDPSLIDPIHEYSHGGGNCSITGGYVYRGCAISGLQGNYFFADFCSNKIWSFQYDGVNKTNFQDRTASLDPSGPQSINDITSFGEDAGGELYIVDRGGEIFKILPDAPSSFEDLGFGKSGTGNVVPILEVCGQTGSGDEALLRLRKANPFSLALFLLSFDQNPVSKFGGTILPDFMTGFIIELSTSSKGNIFIPFDGGGGPVDVYAQYLIQDPGATQGVAFSNAVKVMIDP
jgi:glucose/arabinose dehydrogenase